ncbi:TRI15 protein [Colletotrichum orchidophilum]|uniref:TRI15 protein n=1 Tax=Colletotrichum orchidophilum TaxID=1209926 RepID=A0A1G4BKY9_9PEZI|nr:TRI15 protein [Colletotrichum orchidophilum]OHF02119.1 TRI15 protein [Colletotrichum orchidophilum]
MDSSSAAMQPFAPGQCLFCSILSPNFPASVTHMQKSHGLFIPHRQNLVVDIETLFKYLHLVIFAYRECLHCGTERTTVQAVQQHMIGKGHCRFDPLERNSEFADFYDFIVSEAEDGEESYTESGDEEAASPNRQPLQVDEDSLRLPSGKIISKRSTEQMGPSINHVRRQIRIPPSQLEYTRVESDEEESSEARQESGTCETQALSKREKRERAVITHQLANMRANDRKALMHLPTSQQRSLLAAQHRNEEKVQKEERRRQGKIDRKGNKNLHAYWHTETPIFQCG